MNSARQILARHGISAKKSLGQNFLIDDDVLDTIVASADLTANDCVLEVGPGLGVLTKELAQRARRVIAVELDPRMVPIVRETVAGHSNVQIVQADILETNPTELAGEPYLVVANLPYYITSLVLRHFLEAEVPPYRLVIMVQKEVAERITAKPGSLSLLAVSVQVYGEARIVGQAPARCFFPAPDVDSAVVRVDTYRQPRVLPEQREAFFKVVSAGFSQPRKQLHNALAQRLWFPPNGAVDSLREAGIDPGRRAATVTIDEWLKLTEIIERDRPARTEQD